MNQLTGQQLDNFQIIDNLGQGGIGTVYRARDTKLNRDVALKVMHLHLAEQPVFRARFLQEAQVAANLDHSNIVKIFDYKESGELLYIVMEFVAGGNLAQRMAEVRKSQQPMLLVEIIHLIQQIADALDYAHEKGVLHLDIKPANILLKPNGSAATDYRPVLADMGLAALMKNGVVTQDGEPVGTPTYIAPEQVLGQPVSPVTDLYALGVVLYELVVGQLPYQQAMTLAEARRIHERGSPPRQPSEVWTELPRALEPVLLQAVAREPTQRFTSGHALVQAMNSAGSIAAGQTASLPVRNPISKPPDSSPLQPNEFAEPVFDIVIDSVPLTVDPGSAVKLPFKVYNQSDIIVHAQINVSGVPVDWLSYSLEPRFGPRQEKDGMLTVTSPPDSRAAQYTLTIHVIRESTLISLAKTNIDLTINAHHKFDVKLIPQEMSSERQGVFDVVIDNQGNDNLSVNLIVTKQEVNYTYQLEPPQLEIVPGDSFRGQLKVKSKTPLYDRKPRSVPFVLVVAPQNAVLSPQQVSGAWEELPQELIHPWIWLLGVILVGIILSLGAFYGVGPLFCRGTNNIMACPAQFRLAQFVTVVIALVVWGIGFILWRKRYRKNIDLKPLEW